MDAGGPKSLKAMLASGAATIGQNESTSVVYGMAKVAFELDAVQMVPP